MWFFLLYNWKMKMQKSWNWFNVDLNLTWIGHKLDFVVLIDHIYWLGDIIWQNCEISLYFSILDVWPFRSWPVHPKGQKKNLGCRPWPKLSNDVSLDMFWMIFIFLVTVHFSQRFSHKLREKCQSFYQFLTVYNFWMSNVPRALSIVKINSGPSH